MIKKRNQNSYRSLLSNEIDILTKNRNYADNWNNIKVTGNFDPQRVANSHFEGPVLIGNLNDTFNSYNGLKLQTGIYNSRLISTTVGNNASIHNATYISNYIIEDKCILFNLGELICSDKARFGEACWINVANENGGKKLLSFNGIIEADSCLWTMFREDIAFLEKLEKMTGNLVASAAVKGYIGKNSVIKHVKSIVDCKTGSGCIINGSACLKNLTINSSATEKTYVGTNVEIENSIIGFANIIDSAAKCFNIISGRNVAIKLGARVLHSFVGSNSTIACCEILNNMIFPLHEQHHNNSFLIACSIGGQSNIAAGATIGSNHNSRAADGEIIARRGFWPGLNSSFKHNSQFASFTLVAKASYQTELNIALPFSLVSQNNEGTVQVFPGFWFRYNMYALARNAWKFKHRDKRKIKDQNIEYDYLAPDTLLEMLSGIALLAKVTEKDSTVNMFDYSKIDDLQNVYLDGVSPASKALLIKPLQGMWLYKAMIAYAAAKEILYFYKGLPERLPDERTIQNWTNLGGQLILQNHLDELVFDIKENILSSWQDIHDRYNHIQSGYQQNKAGFALACYQKISDKQKLQKVDVTILLKHYLKMNELIWQWTHDSRQKDYSNSFRKMIYKNDSEMDAVIGLLNENVFINDMKMEMEKQNKDIITLLEKLNGK